MATIQELDDLTLYIRRMLPDLRQLRNVHRNETAGLVQFEWYARHFVVMPTLRVFELKGQSLMLTCSSILMQAALQTKDRNIKIITQIVESLRAAEDTMGGNQREGLALLTTIKRSLLKLMGKQSSDARNPPRTVSPP